MVCDQETGLIERLARAISACGCATESGENSVLSPIAYASIGEYPGWLHGQTQSAEKRLLALRV